MAVPPTWWEPGGDGRSKEAERPPGSNANFYPGSVHAAALIQPDFLIAESTMP